MRHIVARLTGRAVRALAHGVRPVSALAPSRRVAPIAGPGAKRDGLAPTRGRFLKDVRTHEVAAGAKKMTAPFARRSAAAEAF